jgi:hypothetical protein
MSEESKPGHPGNGRRWLLVTVSTAGAPASLRVQVWRRLRSLGALYLHQSVCLLPATAPVARQVSRLLDRVSRDGGTGRCLRLSLDDPAQEASIVAEFRAARDAEYAEVVERVPGLLAELEMEQARGRATYAEVEESEADLARFQAWLAKIEARDYFDAPGRGPARAAVARCEAELAAFEAAALAAESPEPPAAEAGAAGQVAADDGGEPSGPAGRLRAVQ